MGKSYGEHACKKDNSKQEEKELTQVMWPIFFIFLSLYIHVVVPTILIPLVQKSLIQNTDPGIQDHDIVDDTREERR